MKLNLILDYHLNEDKFNVDGNIKEELRTGFVSDFLMTQIGAGGDTNALEERDDYQIRISLDVENDKYTVLHNCGNEGLRDGILMRYAGIC